MTETSPGRKASSLRTVWWVLAAMLGVGLVVGGYFALFKKETSPKWVLANVTRGDVVQVVNATGTLQPLLLSPVGSQVSGIVHKIYADFNDPVKKGQVLVELDPALFQTAVRSQEANVVSAQANLLRARADAQNAARNAERARALFAKNYISTADRDSALALEQSTAASVQATAAGVQLAQAALEKARLDLKNSVILSPVDGVVISRNVELGQAVVASFQAPNLFQIAGSLTKMQVLANVDEADIGFLHVGATAEFAVDSFRGRRFAARVSQIRNAAQTVQNVVTYVVVLDVDNAELALRPGMTANVRVVVSEKKNVLLVPSAALRFKPRLERSGTESRVGQGGPRKTDRPEGRNKTPIFSPDGDRARLVFVKIGISDGAMTEISEGLEEGSSVIVDLQKNPTSSSPNPMGGSRPPGPSMRRVGL